MMRLVRLQEKGEARNCRFAMLIVGLVGANSLVNAQATGSTKPPAQQPIRQEPIRIQKSWVEREFLDRIDLSGSRTLGYQQYNFIGDADAFNSLTNYGTGLQKFTDIGNLSLQGNKVFGFLNFRANFTDNRFSDPEQQQYLLSYQRGAWDLNYGTVQASLQSSNRFLNFSRSIDGMVAGFKQGRFETRLLRSEARGAARTATIEGNNTSGPYFLQSGRIIGGTVNVLVDGVQLQQGRDFVINTDEGSLTFIGRTISPSSTIIASYESFDLSSARGSINGAKVAYDFGRAGAMAFTQMEQVAATGTNNNERIELFQGFGKPGDQYFLQFEPIPASIVVTVNGTIRSFSTFDDGVSEFFQDPVLPIRIISRIAVPITQELQIRYTPKRLNTASGNRKVSGFDWNLPLNKSRSNSLNYSSSSGGPTGGSAGSAESVYLRVREGKGDLDFSLRKIDPNYQGIEQTAFNRNESASDTRFSYYTKGVRSEVKNLNSVISVIDSNTVTNTRLVSNGLTVTYGDPSTNGVITANNPFGRARRTQNFFYNTTQTANSNDSFISSLGIGESYSYRRLTYNVGVENRKGNGKINNVQTDLNLDSIKSSVSYNAGKNVSVSASASQSNVKTNIQSSVGYDYSLRANLAQTGFWSGGIDYTVSDSGELASLGGFLNGNSIGFGNSGFSGSNGLGTISNGNYSVRRLGVNFGYQGAGAYSSNFSFSRTNSTGSATNNADIQTLTWSQQYQINENNAVSLDWTKVDSVFQSSSVGSATSYLVNAQLNGALGRLWSYNLGLNTLTSTGGSFAQDSFGLQGDVTYFLNSRQRLIGSISANRTSGLLPQEDTQVQAAYAYMIIPGIDLRARYSFRDLQNLDATSVGGAFRSNGLSLELTFSLLPRR